MTNIDYCEGTCIGPSEALSRAPLAELLPAPSSGSVHKLRHVERSLRPLKNYASITSGGELQRTIATIQ
jgi:hypothetical protein